MATVWLKVVVVLSMLFTVRGTPELVVNVRSKSGDITQKEFESFPDKELVIITYKLNDGRIFDVWLDFKQKIQIYRTIVLGEMDLAEKAFEMVCFVIRMKDNEYISPDAMAKLRQKNPSTIRSPEEELATRQIVLDHTVQISGVRNMNSHVRKLCGEIDILHINGDDIQFLLDSDTTRAVNKGDAVQNLTSSLKTNKRCRNINDSNKTCICQLRVCLSWYPCDLKYCPGEDNDGKPAEYRCGIKTCGKCTDFDYLISEKNRCFWDDRLGT